MSSAAAEHPAAGDCECIHDGPIAQPVNAASCLAYVAAGAWLWRRLHRTHVLDRGGVVPAAAALYCGMVAANGVGGVAFHGPGDRASHWLHDTALVGTLAAMAIEKAGWSLGLTGVAAVGLAVRPDATNAASLVGGALVVGSEVRRRHKPTARAGLLLLAAAGVNLLSRTGGPWCRPGSVLQGHALWHVLTAAAMAEWGADVFERAA
jgi:hypothetical protein